MKKISVIALAMITASLFSCSNEDVLSSENDSAKNPVGAKSVQGYTLETIDNGLDGQILQFNSVDDYEQTFDELYNANVAYDDYYQEQIPADLNLDEAESYFQSIGYEQEKVYSDFENQLGFNSLRKQLNLEDEIWFNSQNIALPTADDIGNSPTITTPSPHNFRIGSDADRVLFNSGAEVIVIDSLGSPVIYKEFNWGSLIIRNMDTDLLKSINVNKIKDKNSIISLIAGNTNYEPVPIPINCQTESKVERYYWSGAGQLSRARTHAYRPILTKKTRHSATTIGYLYKNGKWRRKDVWLQVGICGIKNQPMTNGRVALGECSQYILVSCVSHPPSKCKRSYETIAKSDDTAFHYDNSVYSFHGQGTYSYTIDFYGDDTWGHEKYEISR